MRKTSTHSLRPVAISLDENEKKLGRNERIIIKTLKEFQSDQKKQNPSEKEPNFHLLTFLPSGQKSLSRRVTPESTQRKGHSKTNSLYNVDELLSHKYIQTKIINENKISSPEIFRSELSYQDDLRASKSLFSIKLSERRTKLAELASTLGFKEKVEVNNKELNLNDVLAYVKINQVPGVNLNIFQSLNKTIHLYEADGMEKGNQIQNLNMSEFSKVGLLKQVKIYKEKKMPSSLKKVYDFSEGFHTILQSVTRTNDSNNNQNLQEFATNIFALYGYGFKELSDRLRVYQFEYGEVLNQLFTGFITHINDILQRLADKINIIDKYHSKNILKLNEEFTLRLKNKREINESLQNIVNEKEAKVLELSKKISIINNNLRNSHYTLLNLKKEVNKLEEKNHVYQKQLKICHEYRLAIDKFLDELEGSPDIMDMVRMSPFFAELSAFKSILKKNDREILLAQDMSHSVRSCNSQSTYKNENIVDIVYNNIQAMEFENNIDLKIDQFYEPEHLLVDKCYDTYDLYYTKNSGSQTMTSLFDASTQTFKITKETETTTNHFVTYQDNEAQSNQSDNGFSKFVNDVGDISLELLLAPEIEQESPPANIINKITKLRSMIIEEPVDSDSDSKTPIEATSQKLVIPSFGIIRSESNNANFLTIPVESHPPKANTEDAVIKIKIPSSEPKQESKNILTENPFNTSRELLINNENSDDEFLELNNHEASKGVAVESTIASLEEQITKNIIDKLPKKEGKMLRILLNLYKDILTYKNNDLLEKKNQIGNLIYDLENIRAKIDKNEIAIFKMNDLSKGNETSESNDLESLGGMSMSHYRKSIKLDPDKSIINQSKDQKSKPLLNKSTNLISSIQSKEKVPTYTSLKASGKSRGLSVQYTEKNLFLKNVSIKKKWRS